MNEKLYCFQVKLLKAVVVKCDVACSQPRDNSPLHAVISTRVMQAQLTGNQLEVECGVHS